MKKECWIERDAMRYADNVKAMLEAEPISGVNPTIAYNAHRMGYERGAYDVHDKYVPIILREHRAVKVWQWYGMVMSVLSVILSLLLILK